MTAQLTPHLPEGRYTLVMITERSTTQAIDALVGRTQQKPRKVAWKNHGGHISRTTHLADFGAAKSYCGWTINRERMTHRSATGRLCAKCVAHLIGMHHGQVYKIGPEKLYDEYWEKGGGENLETMEKKISKPGSGKETFWWDRIEDPKVLAITNLPASLKTGRKKGYNWYPILDAVSRLDLSSPNGSTLGVKILEGLDVDDAMRIGSSIRRYTKTHSFDLLVAVRKQKDTDFRDVWLYPETTTAE